MTDSSTSRLTTKHWLIIIIASIGFLFDTYELLMTPLVGVPAIAEFLKVPRSHPDVTMWMGNLLWITALCGGVFGLLGGRLIDQFGRKRIMALSIFLYSFAPFAAAYSQSLTTFILFRCLTFIGVCVEFVAAITWLAEVFEDKKQRGRWLGITQAFASLGGVLVTVVAIWIGKHINELPHWGLPGVGEAGPDKWRYLLLTGILPALPIALLLPFVPESRVWKEKKLAGTLQRPSFGALFAPELRRATLVSAALSACAYGIAFGALQLTPKSIAPGLPELTEQTNSLKPLRGESKKLIAEFDATTLGTPERKAVQEKLSANAKAQKPFTDIVDSKGDQVQFYQEMGGLVGRILLAILVIAGMAHGGLLRLFQIPSLIILPLTYLYVFKQGGEGFLWAYALCGLLTVAQFSYMGEYLPKVFPLHLRGTGGSFATNVGGRMVGTSMAIVTTKLVAPLIAGGAELVKPMHTAQAAGYVASGIALLGFLIGWFLPKPKESAEGGVSA